MMVFWNREGNSPVDQKRRRRDQRTVDLAVVDEIDIPDGTAPPQSTDDL